MKLSIPERIMLGVAILVSVGLLLFLLVDWQDGAESVAFVLFLVGSACLATYALVRPGPRLLPAVFVMAAVVTFPVILVGSLVFIFYAGLSLWRGFAKRRVDPDDPAETDRYGAADAPEWAKALWAWADKYGIDGDKLPRNYEKLASLTALDLSKNSFSNLPAEIWNLTTLNRLDLSENYLEEIPPEIERLTRLTYLDLSWLELTKTASEIGKLTNLTYLDLGGNKLAELSPEIGKLTNLEHLDLASGELTEVPAELWTLKSLKYLDLNANYLRDISEEIGNLTNLEYLDLRANGLEELPQGIEKLVKLKNLPLGSKE